MASFFEIFVYVLMFGLFLIYGLTVVIVSLALASLIGRKAYQITNNVTESILAKSVVAIIFAVPTLALSATGCRFLTEKIGLFGLFERYGFV